MSFDWQSFATGFMERTTEILKERQEEAKTFEEEQRAAAERNAATISRRRAIADQVTGYANYLQSNGVSNEQIQAVIASGPRAIEQLTERVQQAVTANGGRPLGTSDAETLITMPEGFSPVDMTTQEFIDQTYGLGVRETQPREDREFGFMDRLFGRDQMPRAQDRLNRTPFVEGMTIEEVNRVAMQSDYESIIPGTFVSITSGRSAYDFDASTDFTTTFERRLATLQDSERWTQTLGMPLEERATAQAALLEEAMGPIIRMGISTFGDALIADQDSYLRSIMGDDYMDSLIERETAPAPSPTTTPAPTTDGSDTEVEQPADTDVGAGVATPMPETTATTATQAPVAADTDAGVDVVTPLPEPTATTATQAPVAPVAADTDVDDPEPAEEDTLPEPPEDTRIRNPETGELVTYQQWQQMSRIERADLGLPVSFLGGQRYFRRFGVGLGTVDPETGVRITKQSTESMQTEQPEMYQVLSDQGVDDITIALLSSKGSDMLQYLQEQGATDQEAAFNALTDWGQQNNIVMPFDKAGLIYALLSVLNR
jgi:hypothetical protein